MKVSLVKTADGSYSLYNESLDEQYHSKHGAVLEAQHVFIKNGWEAIDKNEVRIFEMGFGTGLNFLMTMAANNQKKIYYEAVESYPLEESVWSKMNYPQEINRKDLTPLLKQAHQANWNEIVQLNHQVQLKKVHAELATAQLSNHFDLVYFDAFGPRVQPDLWSKEVFDKIYQHMAANGILVTYSAKGDVRRNMMASGFQVEKLPGPPGKREMLRAQKR